MHYLFLNCSWVSFVCVCVFLSIKLIKKKQCNKWIKLQFYLSPSFMPKAYRVKVTGTFLYFKYTYPEIIIPIPTGTDFCLKAWKQLYQDLPQHFRIVEKYGKTKDNNTAILESRQVSF